VGAAVLMTGRQHNHRGSLDDILDARIYRKSEKDQTMKNEQLPLGEIGYWVSVASLIALLGLVFYRAVGF
jgi:hypothetical protein